MDAQKISVCCSGKCPTISITSNSIAITDDYGGIVLYSEEEFETAYAEATQTIADLVTLTDKHQGSVQLTPAELLGLHQTYEESRLVVG